MMEEFSEIIPDAIEPAEYWRSWWFHPRDVLPGQWIYRPENYHDNMLRSWNQTRWYPREKLIAHHSGYDSTRHRLHPRGNEIVPVDGCRCGIYATTHENMPIANVIGKVKLWGKVIPGETGMRAQYAYPSKLIVPYWEWTQIEELLAFGVPITYKHLRDPVWLSYHSSHGSLQAV